MTKLIGYDWDNAMLCEVPGKDALVEQLAADEERPVPTGVTLEPGGTALMTGYQLDGVAGTVSWRGSDGSEQGAEISPEASVSFPDYGSSRPAAHPAALQAVRFRLDVEDIDSSARGSPSRWRARRGASLMGRTASSPLRPKRPATPR